MTLPDELMVQHSMREFGEDIDTLTDMVRFCSYRKEFVLASGCWSSRLRVAYHFESRSWTPARGSVLGLRPEGPGPGRQCRDPYLSLDCCVCTTQGRAHDATLWCAEAQEGENGERGGNGRGDGV